MYKRHAKYNPDPSRQYGGFIDYESGKEYIARIGTPVYYKWVDRTITEKVEVEKTIPCLLYTSELPDEYDTEYKL